MFDPTVSAFALKARDHLYAWASTMGALETCVGEDRHSDPYPRNCLEMLTTDIPILGHGGRRRSPTGLAASVSHHHVERPE
jgi:hypothetical protein